MKGLYLRFKRMFLLLFSKEYILIVNKDDERFEICHNKCCTSCLLDMMEEAESVLIDIENDELDQEDAVNLANRIINNKN